MAEDIDTISFAYDSPMSLQTLNDPPLPLQILPQIDPLTSVDLSVRDIRWQIAAE